MDVQQLPTSIPGLSPTPSGTAGPGRRLDDFGGSLTEALDSLSGLQHQADRKVAELATGEPVELHEVMLAQEQASLSFQLAVQVRNKLVEAYQDVMRMQL